MARQGITRRDAVKAAGATGVALGLASAIKGDAPAEKLREIVEQSRARSAVFDVLTNGVPIELTIEA